MSEESRARFATEARAAAPDPALLCLLIGCEEDPELGAPIGTRLDTVLAHWLRMLDRLAFAAGEAGCDDPGLEPSVLVSRLAGALAGAAEFRGGPGAYRYLDSSLLHRVLRRRRGLPIMLSLVWTEVGRRLGLPVHPVALPGHFVVGVGDLRGSHVLADPFHGGRLLSYADAAELCSRSGQTMTPDLLSPAEPLDVVLRVLGNVRSWAAARPEHARVQLWATELSLLLPRHPAQLRLERGELLVKTGRFVEGAKEMEAFATILDTFDRESAARVRREAQAARHRLN